MNFCYPCSVSSWSLAVAVSVSLGPAWQAQGEVTFEVRLDDGLKEISPLIYGLNDWSRDATAESLGYTLERMGGNRMTGYNWENNFSNAGSDYIHHSDGGLVSEAVPENRPNPGEAVKLSVDHARSGGRPSLVTLQLAGYVAADGDGVVSESEAAPSARWKEVRIRKDAPYSLNPDTTDDFVYLDEQVAFLIETYGLSSEGGVFGYSLDNEPSVWPFTHARLHPELPTVAEIVEQGAECAQRVKELDPDALIFGPALYGYGAYVDFGAPDWPSYDDEYDWFLSAYLGEMRKRSESAGRRLLDVMDIHYYPEVAVVTGKDSEGDDIYTRITDNSSDNAALAEARLQAPRSLWDATFVEESWITQWSTGGAAIELLPRVFTSIETHNPGTKLSISEYDFGGRQNYSGGLAQVDVLGIFGRDGLFAACFWGEAAGFIVPAFRLFRNFDGEGSTFGDVSISLSNSDAERYSGYAALHSETGALHFILINKTAEAEQATLDLGELLGNAIALTAYGFSEATGPVIEKMDTQQVVLGSSMVVPLPARSAAHYVLAFAPRESQPVFPRLDPSSQDSFRLTALTILGRRYQLQSSPDLRSWSDVDAPFFGNGHALERVVSASPGSRFWRVVLDE